MRTLLCNIMILLAACGGNNSPSNVKSPGEDKNTDTKVLETGADLLQDKTPIKRFIPTWMDFIFTMAISMRKWKLTIMYRS